MENSRSILQDLVIGVEGLGEGKGKVHSNDVPQLTRTSDESLAVMLPNLHRTDIGEIPSRQWRHSTTIGGVRCIEIE